MARDAVTVTSLTANGGAEEPTGTSITPANGATIAAQSDCRKLLVRITNTHGSDHPVTIRAGVNPPAFRQGIGDLTVTVPATSGVRYITLSSARFAQSDGTLYLDFETGMTGKVMAFRLPDEI